MAFLKWDEANITWDNANFTWDEAALVSEIVNTAGGGGEEGLSYALTSLTPEKKKKFIKLLCKIEGVEYKETKEIKKRRIRITDVELAAREVLGIDIKVDL